MNVFDKLVMRKYDWTYYLILGYLSMHVNEYDGDKEKVLLYKVYIYIYIYIYIYEKVQVIIIFTWKELIYLIKKFTFLLKQLLGKKSLVALLRCIMYVSCCLGFEVLVCQIVTHR